MAERVGEARQKLALAAIEGAAKLVDFYGYWPSFHDAETNAITIEPDGPTLTITFTTNDLVIKDGERQGDQEARVTMRWYEVQELALRAADWSDQNWLWDMDLVACDDGLRTELLPNDGIGGSILARRVEVLEVEPIEAAPRQT